jgi:beta-ribofuranosylaminobenzene 5'-phosphate synthase
MIRIRTPSRLHFGLFSLPSELATDWLNHEGDAILPGRQFGGVGLMIDKPGIELVVAPAQAWSAEGPLAERAVRFAQTYCEAVGIRDAFHLHIVSAAQEHAGLGTGTQLGLAVARAIAELMQQPARDAVTLARQVGRGLRSALGVHGFERGGFLVEGGKTSSTGISPLLVRHDFPEDWQILLILPRDAVGVHGRREAKAFADLLQQPPDDRTTESLCRLVLLGLLPALLERDLRTFGEALYDFNRRAGEIFRPVQGGIYAHPAIEGIAKVLRDAGVKGVGQSSWGPTFFAVVAVEEVAAIRQRLMMNAEIAREDLMVTSARNEGSEPHTK